MADTILESYLVRLGSTVDVGSFNKFNAVLSQAHNSVSSMTSGVVKDFIKLEGAIVGAFAAVGTGILTLADKSAMADQSYRLFGLRMLMNTGQARAMQMALNNLGATMDEVAYDPELNARFQDLMARNVALGKSLGPMFEKDMQGIRSLRTEYKQFGTQLEMLSMGTVGRLYEKLGLGSGDLLRDVRGLNEEFATNLPKWIDQASTYLVPVWKDFVLVMTEVGSTVKTAALDFTILTGVLTGDKSLQSTEFNIQNLAKATLDWVDGLAQVSLTIQLLGRIGMHTFTAMAESAMGAWKILKAGPTMDAAAAKEGMRLLNLGADQAVMAGADVRDMFTPANKRNNADFAGIVAHADLMRNAGASPSAANGSLGDIVAAAAAKYGQDPALIAGIIKQESGGNSGATSSKGARGLMQLMPSTAQSYGVSDVTDPTQSVRGGTAYLADLMKKYGGDERKALAAYNWGPGNVDSQGMEKMPKETRNYIDSVMRYQAQGESSKGDVTIQSMHITVLRDVPDERMKHIIADSMTEFMAKRDKHVMAQTAGGPY